MIRTPKVNTPEYETMNGECCDGKFKRQGERQPKKENQVGVAVLGSVFCFREQRTLFLWVQFLCRNRDPILGIIAERKLHQYSWFRNACLISQMPT
jgi:hypothetical protein